MNQEKTQDRLEIYTPQGECKLSLSNLSFSGELFVMKINHYLLSKAIALPITEVIGWKIFVEHNPWIEAVRFDLERINNDRLSNAELDDIIIPKIVQLVKEKFILFNKTEMDLA